MIARWQKVSWTAARTEPLPGLAVFDVRPAPIFDVAMSHDAAVADTIAAATAYKRPVRLLEPALDIDTVDDLELSPELGRLELAPRTRRPWESARPRAAH